MYYYKISFVQKELFQLACHIFFPWQSSWFYLCLLCGLLLLYAGLCKAAFPPWMLSMFWSILSCNFFLVFLKLLASWSMYFIICSVNSEIVKLKLLLGLNILELLNVFLNLKQKNIWVLQVEFILKFPLFYCFCRVATVILG